MFWFYLVLFLVGTALLSRTKGPDARILGLLKFGIFVFSGFACVILGKALVSIIYYPAWLGALLSVPWMLGTIYLSKKIPKWILSHFR